MLRHVFAVSFLALACCQKEHEKLPPPSPCSDQCGPGAVAGAGVTSSASTGAGGGGGASSSSSGTGGASNTSTVMGSVVQLVDDTFSNATAYTSSATIVGYDPSNKEVTTPYGGMNGNTFTLMGLA